MKTQTDNEICECGHTLHYHRENHLFSDDGKITNCKVYKCPCKKFTPQKHSQEISEKHSKEPARVSPDALRGNHSPMPPIVQKEYNRLLKKHPQTKQDVLIREWLKGFKDGESSVLEFLEDMKGLGFKEEYNSWAQADEYTKLNGEVVKRYE